MRGSRGVATWHRASQLHNGEVTATISLCWEDGVRPDKRHRSAGSEQACRDFALWCINNHWSDAMRAKAPLTCPQCRKAYTSALPLHKNVVIDDVVRDRRERRQGGDRRWSVELLSAFRQTLTDKERTTTALVSGLQDKVDAAEEAAELFKRRLGASYGDLLRLVAEDRESALRAVDTERDAKLSAVRRDIGRCAEVLGSLRETLGRIGDLERTRDDAEFLQGLKDNWQRFMNLLNEHLEHPPSAPVEFATAGRLQQRIDEILSLFAASRRAAPSLPEPPRAAEAAEGTPGVGGGAAPLPSPATLPAPSPALTPAPSSAPLPSPSTAPPPAPTTVPPPAPTTAPLPSLTTAPLPSPLSAPLSAPSTAPLPSLSSAPLSAPSTALPSAPSTAPPPAPSTAPPPAPSSAPLSAPSTASLSAPSSAPLPSPSTAPLSASSTAPLPSASTAPLSAPTTAPLPSPSSAPLPSPSSAPPPSPTTAPLPSPSSAPLSAPSTAPLSAPSTAPSPATLSAMQEPEPAPPRSTTAAPGHCARSDVSLVCPTKAELIRRYGCSPCLNPDSAHRWLWVSEDRRTVNMNLNQKPPDRPDRFETHQQVLGSDGFSSGRHYWEVDVSKAKWWRVGAAYETIPRKGKAKGNRLGENPVSWCLQKQTILTARHGGAEDSVRTMATTYRRIGLYLDWEAGLLSFYDDAGGDVAVLLHSFEHKFMWPLLPALELGGQFKGSSLSMAKLD
ncbi:uncharacterized protein LOC116956570 isoform X2 [Petromyzon marinus]|uniref:uncharacterized protein LOC116956570 isoform X2 n=1 Tax=Petromyzon marinus TaxID=7757 RepID=UPI003F7059D3